MKAAEGNSNPLGTAVHILQLFQCTFNEKSSAKVEKIFAQLLKYMYLQFTKSTFKASFFFTTCFTTFESHINSAIVLKSSLGLRLMCVE